MIGVVGVLVVWSVEALFLLADRDRGVFALLGIHSEVARAQLEISGLEARRDALRRQSTDLVEDWRAIEAAAREELGMVFPGERVLLIPEDATPERAKPDPGSH